MAKHANVTPELCFPVCACYYLFLRSDVPPNLISSTYVTFGHPGWAANSIKSDATMLGIRKHVLGRKEANKIGLVLLLLGCSGAGSHGRRQQFRWRNIPRSASQDYARGELGIIIISFISTCVLYFNYFYFLALDISATALAPSATSHIDGYDMHGAREGC